ncbi:MAG: GNAT family N-acetyltransferase [Myxococcales bacterium]|nr:GNAT family N-acetyltransferase [Myxococcales bacterium]
MAATWRPARPDEDEAVMALVRLLYAEDPSPEAVPDAHTRRTLEAFRASPLRGRVVVLDDGAGVAGYALLASFWSNELGGETCEVDELYVAAPLRGRGHATRLLRELAAGSELWGSRPAAVCLQVTADNRRARALYRRLGFVESKNTFMVLRSR